MRFLLHRLLKLQFTNTVLADENTVLDRVLKLEHLEHSGVTVHFAIAPECASS